MTKVDTKNNNQSYLIGGTVSTLAGIGSAYAYSKSPAHLKYDGLVKDGKVTERFRESIKDYLLKVPPKDVFENPDKVEKIVKDIEKINNGQELKNYFQNNIAKIQGWNKKDFEMLLGNIETLEINKAKNLLKDAIYASDSKYNNEKYYQDLFEKSWDKTTKSFKHNTAKVNNSEFESITKAAKHLKGQQAISLGIANALLGGLITILVANLIKKNQ